MIRRQIHVGRMQYALLYQQKELSLMTDSGWKLSAIPLAYVLYRTKALHNSCDLSAAPNESTPNQRRPIRCTGQSPIGC